MTLAVGETLNTNTTTTLFAKAPAIGFPVHKGLITAGLIQVAAKTDFTVH